MANIAEWLTLIQGKHMPNEILDSIKKELGSDISSIPKKMLFDSINAIIRKNNYDIDPKKVYEYFLGLHIDPLDPVTESLILSAFQRIFEEGGVVITKIPNIYILQKISQKYNLGIKETLQFPKDKTTYYDGILNNFI